jgi:hypothetical protein
LFPYDAFLQRYQTRGYFPQCIVFAAYTPLFGIFATSARSATSITNESTNLVAADGAAGWI